MNSKAILTVRIGACLLAGLLCSCAVTGVGYEEGYGYGGDYVGGIYEPYGYEYGGWGGRYRVGPPPGGGWHGGGPPHGDAPHGGEGPRGEPPRGGGGRAPSIPSGPRGGGGHH